MIERTYIIPLRKEWQKAPKYKRAKKAVTGVKRFLKRHMRVTVENVKIGKALNEELWKHGMRNPPAKVKVNITKDDQGLVKAELFGHKFVQSKEDKSKVEKKVTETKEDKPKKTVKKETKPKTKETTKDNVQTKPVKETAKPTKEEKSVESTVKEVIKNKNKDPAVKKGEEKIKEELVKLEQQTEQIAVKAQ